MKCVITHVKGKKMMNLFLPCCISLSVHVDKLEEAEPAAVELHLHKYLMGALKIKTSSNSDFSGRTCASLRRQRRSG